MPKTHRKTVDTVFILIGLIATGLLLVIGVLALKAGDFAISTVRSELASQRIYFPQKGSPGFSASEFPDLQQYAGQLVDTGPKAKAYANGYIGRHLQKVANGQTYAEVSAEAQKDPANTQLQQEKQTLFQGETLRGLLLGDGYAYWTFGVIAKDAAYALFASAAAIAVLVWLGLIHRSRL